MFACQTRQPGSQAEGLISIWRSSRRSILGRRCLHMFMEPITWSSDHIQFKCLLNWPSWPGCFKLDWSANWSLVINWKWNSLRLLPFIQELAADSEVYCNLKELCIFSTLSITKYSYYSIDSDLISQTSLVNWRPSSVTMRQFLCWFAPIFTGKKTNQDTNKICCGDVFEKIEHQIFLSCFSTYPVKKCLHCWWPCILAVSYCLNSFNL
jgi:hypothetical protein